VGDAVVVEERVDVIDFVATPDDDAVFEEAAETEGLRVAVVVRVDVIVELDDRVPVVVRDAVVVPVVVRELVTVGVDVLV
jgi:hypothetical protein